MFLTNLIKSFYGDSLNTLGYLLTTSTQDFVLTGNIRMSDAFVRKILVENYIVVLTLFIDKATLE